MRSKIGAGIAAGLLAGIVFGLLMQVMTMPEGGPMAMPAPGDMPMAAGGRKPMMTMFAQVLGSDRLVLGWIYILVSSVVMGGIFGWLLGGRATRLGGGLAWGALYGILLWLLGALALMPVLVGMDPFSPITMPSMRPTAMASLGAHVVSGLVLGGAFAGLYRGKPSSSQPTTHG